MHKSNKPSLKSIVAKEVARLLDHEPGLFFTGCWCVEKGEINPAKFITFLRVEYMDRDFKANSINRTRQKVLEERRRALALKATA